MRSVVIHAHCYQPPREDPWLELVPPEVTASPDHDWNARITRECYARLAATEVRVAPVRPDEDPTDPHAFALSAPAGDEAGGLARLVNCFAWCPFDVGPTLVEWLVAHAPAVWEAILAADRASVARLGHGNALAAPYHHVILPLASRRDKVTEVRWGIADFTRRFGRAPEGFWLPETAVDEETLDVLAEEGIRYTVLAPWQVRNPDPAGRPLRWRAAGGRELALFTYDGSISGDVAFGGLLRDAGALADRLAPPSGGGVRADAGLTVMATDGETFGHHHAGGEVTLARAIARLAARTDVRVSNFGAALAAMPPAHDAELVAPSAWSCAHGVERWRSDCGCRLDAGAGTSQAWRGPLRSALAWLAEQSHGIFALGATPLLADDPWAVRDAYGEIVAEDGEPLARWVRERLRPDRRDDADALVRARMLLELERATLRTFTSCAWFFDDVARIEVRQVLRYAARALALGGRSERLRPAFTERLAQAVSNDRAAGTAGDLFVRTAVPRQPPAERVAAAAVALAADGLLAETLGAAPRLGCFDVDVAPAASEDERRAVTVVHRRTGETTRHEGTVLRLRADGLPRISLRSLRRGRRQPPVLYDVRDFPDAAARALLAPYATTPFPDAPFAPFTPR